MKKKLSEDNKGVLSLDSLYFDNFNYQLFKNKDKHDLEFEFEKQNKSLENNAYEIRLKCFANGKEDSIKISLELVAIFTLNDQEFSDVTKKRIIDMNTIAIMFPYLRTHLSVITCMPNMSPIVLPTININKLFEKDED